MKFINWQSIKMVTRCQRLAKVNWRNGLYLLAISILLNACSMMPSTKETADEPQPESLDQESGPVYVFDGPDENPYLTQEVNVPKAAQQLFSQAVAAMQKENWQDAELLLKELTAQYTELSGPFLNLGIVYRQTDRIELAEQAFLQAIEVNSLNLEAYNQLGLLKREQGDFAAAEQYYLNALQVWPKHAPSHKNIAILYDLYMGKWDRALDHFRKYEYLAGEGDKLIAGWIIDLQRRVDASM